MPVDKAEIDVTQDAAREVADLVIDHLRTMYPDALKAVPSSAVISLRNTTTSAVARAIDAATAAERVKHTEAAGIFEAAMNKMPSGNPYEDCRRLRIEGTKLLASLEPSAIVRHRNDHTQ